MILATLSPLLRWEQVIELIRLHLIDLRYLVICEHAPAIIGHVRSLVDVVAIAQI